MNKKLLILTVILLFLFGCATKQTDLSENIKSETATQKTSLESCTKRQKNVQNDTEDFKGHLRGEIDVKSKEDKMVNSNLIIKKGNTEYSLLLEKSNLGDPDLKYYLTWVEKNDGEHISLKQERRNGVFPCFYDNSLSWDEVEFINKLFDFDIYEKTLKENIKITIEIEE